MGRLWDDAAMDFEAEGLLQGLEGDQRAAREQLLQRLVEAGFDAEQLRRAVAENRLALLPVDRVLAGAYTAREVEQRTGLPAAQVIRARRLLGLPQADLDEPVFSCEDIEAARATKLFLEAGFDEDAIAETNRVLGEGMARVAETVTDLFAQTFLSAGDSEEEVAMRFAQLAQRLTPALTPVLVSAFKAHLGDSVRRGVLGRDELETGDLPGSQELAVCFADLVDFTRLGGQLELRELGTVAGQLSQLAAQVSEPPVRLIKTIGDAAMFVSPEAGPLVAVTLALVRAAQEAELPSLRAGIALGPALLRAGDYYGSSVNLASRVTAIARPGSVLCTQEVRDAAGDEGLLWSSAGRHRLKGFPSPMRLYRARPQDPNADGGAAPRAHGPDSGAKRPRGGRSRRPARS